MIVKEVYAKGILSKSKVFDYTINPYIGCEHGCTYCYARFMNRFTDKKFHSGVVYPLLYQLEDEGFITGVWKQKGRRRIKLYSITDKGERMLTRLRELF
ncbi:helix-turn-helix transcriptional regulator [Candidatus Bathyarchaeota archaeon]|nr:helix-turn-helix transcriptional regulator [Candidatus Bathyarchaeota archaeon]